ncbi:HlyD family secretion protein [Lutimonas zeaxanthinifaciens]|uniref:HlyD family secretion protein n=1 Tax=Lutimonas zeaxanthinifaciens TaxID=3060215 RepID=UPI00265C9E00|nr:efflux RND transporter periplasmic adaptor subunit [Lutimonas sp. YSD2104]WKK66701.1 efflux RND transporter periplasmic adaptor subunit [Lutimonas sp. YSD2104]
MKKKIQLIVLIVPVLIILTGIVILMILKPDENKNRVYVGLFETTQIRVGSEVPGRIDSIFVKLGDEVEKGQLLASIKSDILDAKMQQAEGAYSAAESLNEKATKGAREEEIMALKNKYEMARGQYEFAEKSYQRLRNMYKDSLISSQQMDEMTFKRNAAKEQMNAAESLYEMVRKGAREEDKKAARGQLSAVEGKVNEAKAFYEELKIYAPVSGEISAKLAQESEIMPAGYPIFTIQKLEDVHAVLHIREDMLSSFQLGSEIEGTLPAFDDEKRSFRVSYISPMADFADWIPTADKGRMDMKTFEIHLYPVEENSDLRPGMSINIRL